MAENCLFCSIAAGKIPSFKVYEDDIVLAYLDINPFAEGHTLVIPKAHSRGLLDTPDGALADVVSRVKKVASHVVDVLGADGFNIIQNNGEAAGQSVFHLHFHIIPRRKGDPLSFSGTKADFAELEKLAARLRFRQS